MSKTYYKSMSDVPAQIMEAYKAGEWRFEVPPVSTVYWDDLAWINWARFSPEVEKLRNE